MCACASSGGSFDLEAAERRLSELREQSEQPDLWSDPQRAQKVTRELSHLSGRVEGYQRLLTLVADLGAANEMALESGDAELETEVTEGMQSLAREVERLETEMLFSGEMDDHPAILSVNAGAGGTDAQDWTEMLLRMYLRWAEQTGYQAVVTEALAGEEAGIKSATIEVSGPHAYGWLGSEHGVHRLVRLSPFDSAHRRHTAFASVDVVPQLEEDALDIEIPEDELRIDTFRAGGPGGQYVNTTDSAVRITHLPTGLVTTCQSERSQLSNKIVAMKHMKVKLLDRRRQEREAEMAQLRGEQRKIDFGSQIRSYVLHPYQMVKDHRTGAETSNIDRVLDGDLMDLMSSWLQWRARGEPQG